jgi:hypothetical protein
MTKILTITPIEWTIIEHRLSAADAIAECLADTEELNIEESDAYNHAVDLMFDCVKQVARGNITLDLDEMDRVTLEVLKDSLDGSTFFADIYDAVARKEITKGKMLSELKAALSLESKLEALGIKLCIPRE